MCPHTITLKSFIELASLFFVFFSKKDRFGSSHCNLSFIFSLFTFAYFVFLIHVTFDAVGVDFFVFTNMQV